MSMTVTAVDPTVREIFNDMRLHRSHKYVFFRIEGRDTVVVDFKADPVQTSDREADRQCFQEMTSRLTGDKPRYILYEFGFTNHEGKHIQNHAFIFWCDDNSPFMEKMLYNTAKETVKREFIGLSLEFMAKSQTELSYDAMSDEVERKA